MTLGIYVALGLVDLGTQFLYLLSQVLLACIDFARRVLEDSCQLTEFIAAEGDVLQGFGPKLFGLASCRRSEEPRRNIFSRTFSTSLR